MYEIIFQFFQLIEKIYINVELFHLAAPHAAANFLLRRQLEVSSRPGTRRHRAPSAAAAPLPIATAAARTPTADAVLALPFVLLLALALAVAVAVAEVALKLAAVASVKLQCIAVGVRGLCCTANACMYVCVGGYAYAVIYMRVVCVCWSARLCATRFHIADKNAISCMQQNMRLLLVILLLLLLFLLLRVS